MEPRPTHRMDEPKDKLGLTAGQRVLAWIALGCGLIALLFALLRNPAGAETDLDDTSTEQPDQPADHDIPR